MDTSNTERSSSYADWEHRRKRSSSNGKTSKNGDSKENKDVEASRSEVNVSKGHFLEIENLNQIPHWLGPCNLVAALFQIVQAVFLFGFAYMNELTVRLYTNYPTADTGAEEESRNYAVPESSELVSYQLTWYAGFFILIAGVQHLYCVIPSTRQRYEYGLERHQAPSRWIEYSFSCALMKTHIAQVAGITDVHLVVLIFFISHVSMYFPFLHEKINAKARADGYKQNWMPFWMGVVPHLASWTIIFFYFFTGLNRGESPRFVTTIVLSLFLLECFFPLIFVLQWKKVGRFQDFLVGEFAFITMSFTTKTFLAWVTLAGANGYAKN